MPDDTEITEMTEFDAQRVDLVPAGANGFPLLVMKSLDDDAVVVADEAVVDETPVEKADDETAEGEDAPIPEVPDMVEPDEDAYTVPGAGDPEWEAADAANLTAAAQALVVVAQRIAAASDREAAEGEWRSSWRLEDALCAVEAALGIVAALSYVEAGEAADPAEAAAAKSAALSPAAAETLGRARKTLADLLGEQPMSEEDTVQKSEIDALLDERFAQYTEALTALAPAEKAADETSVEDAEVVDEVAEKAADETPVDEVAEKAADETPAVEPEVAEKAAVEPAAGAPEETPVAEVLKSAVAEAIKETLAPALKGLEDRIDAVEKQPAPGGPFLNGSPYAQVLRSIPADGDPADVQKALAEIPDPSLRAQAARAIDIARATKAYGG